MRVEIKELLRQKSPTLERYTPCFVKSYLRHVLHQRELNEYLDMFSHLPTIEFIRASLGRMGVSSTITGLDKLDRDGRYVFASNHPFGGLDGVILAERVDEYFGDVKVVVNDILMNVEPMKSIFIPVNKHGRQSAEYAKLYKEAFESDVPIITFPAGLCSRRKGGVVEDLEWKPSFVRHAIANQRDVVPVYFEGHLSNFFYRLANLRSALGVKANIEMLYLVDEMFKQSGEHFKIVVGEPIAWKRLEAKHPRQMAAEVRKLAYGLKENR